MTSLRGKVITVIDGRYRFGMTAANVSAESRILILEAGPHVIGMLVDTVSEVKELRQSEIASAPYAGNQKRTSFIEGVCNRENEILIILDPNKVLSSDDYSQLQVA
jgi:purine-binding chemotaxis protein CheW